MHPQSNWNHRSKHRLNSMAVVSYEVVQWRNVWEHGHEQTFTDRSTMERRNPHSIAARCDMETPCIAHKRNTVLSAVPSWIVHNRNHWRSCDPTVRSRDWDNSWPKSTSPIALSNVIVLLVFILSYRLDWALPCGANEWNVQRTDLTDLTPPHPSRLEARHCLLLLAAWWTNAHTMQCLSHTDLIPAVLNTLD